jgi:hypothetical protein
LQILLLICSMGTGKWVRRGVWDSSVDMWMNFQRPWHNLSGGVRNSSVPMFHSHQETAVLAIKTSESYNRRMFFAL